MDTYFDEIVLSSFKAVADRFGLACTAADDRAVVFANDRIVLVIQYDSTRSFELSVDIGRKTGETYQDLVSLAQILRLRGSEQATSNNCVMVSQSSQLPGVLERLARLTSEFAPDFLNGDAAAFAEASALRQREVQAYALMQNLRAHRTTAYAAWQRRDYETLIRTLEDIETYLSPAERQKLVYARRQVGKLQT